MSVTSKMGGSGLCALCVFLTLCIQPVESACTLPFTGNWTTSNRGTWTVTSAAIQGFKMYVDTSGSSLWEMECYSTDGTNYVLKSTAIFQPFTSVDTYIYTCISFTKETDNKYLFSIYTANYQVTTSPAVYERVILKHISVITVGQSEVCSDTLDLGMERFHVALQTGFETAGAVTCPTSIQSTWSYSYTGLSCSSTTLETCSDKTKFAYNDTECTDNPMFSADGTLYCIHTATSGGSTYLTLYNADATVTNPTTFQFVCMIYTISGSTVSASVNPEACVTGQTSTSISTTDGKLVTYSDKATSACNAVDPVATEETDLTWLYILIGVLLFVIIVLIIIILLCIFCRRRKRPKIDDEERNITEDSEDDKSTKSDEQEEPEQMKHEQEKEPTTEETKEDDEEDDRNSQDSGFIPDKIDKEEQKRSTLPLDTEEKREEEVRVEGDGQTKEMKRDRALLLNLRRDRGRE
uniref:Uncharacterized protein LOC111125504 isoform X2 n=1 Tax=Crassostrea virginica TaxID=6565 RepID=A0A8B8DAP7_CRAVI|nr:uncharacterized protein LOC111125504 isoform X2 [Crassostrea virginica]